MRLTAQLNAILHRRVRVKNLAIPSKDDKGVTTNAYDECLMSILDFNQEVCLQRLFRRARRRKNTPYDADAAHFF